MNRYEAKNGQPVQMDNLRYLYQSGSNKLSYVTDNVGAGEFDHDVDTQSSGNYSYDASGNLITDQSERIRKIEWTPSGKVRRIVKEKAIRDIDIMTTFLYDAAGNRVAKKFTNIDTHTEIGTMFYVPDAQGNIMATYNRTITYNLMSQPVDINYWLVEQPVYGSGRLGIRSSTGYLVRKASYGQFGRITDYRTTYAGLTTRTIGHKQYELTDHLGNVRVVFDDRITGTLQTNTLKPNILATNSYYPYGMLIKSLSQNSEVYRWGFQGHEQDNEIKGIGNHLRFGDYGYDTRLGRRWNLDPVYNEGISGYAVFDNNPVYLIDLNGESPISIFAKQVIKAGLKKAAKETVEKVIKNRLKAYMSKKWAKQLAGDALDAIDLATSQSWWEYAIEFVPVAGDVYGAAKLGEQGYKAYKITQKFESAIEWTTKAANKTWKYLGANKLIGKGADKLGDYARRFNNQGSHLTEDDLAGAVKEIYGLSSGVSEKTGKAYKHLQEVTDALGGMNDQIKSLSKDIQKGVFEGDALDVAKGVLSDVSKQYKDISNILNSAKKAAKNF